MFVACIEMVFREAALAVEFADNRDSSAKKLEAEKAHIVVIVASDPTLHP